MRVNAADVANVLASEFPGISILGRGDVMVFKGLGAKACRRRAQELVRKAQLFNAHHDVGHVHNKRNWWKRV